MRWFRQHVFGVLSIILLSVTLIASWVAGLVPFDFWTPQKVIIHRNPVVIWHRLPVVRREKTDSPAEKEIADIELEIAKIESKIAKIRQSKHPEHEKKIKIRELKLDKTEKELKKREIELNQRELASPQQILQSPVPADRDETKTDDNSIRTRIIALFGFFGLLSGAIQMVIYVFSVITILSRVVVSKRTRTV